MGRPEFDEDAPVGAAPPANLADTSLGHGYFGAAAANQEVAGGPKKSLTGSLGESFRDGLRGTS